MNSYYDAIKSQVTIGIFYCICISVYDDSFTLIIIKFIVCFLFKENHSLSLPNL